MKRASLKTKVKKNISPAPTSGTVFATLEGRGTLRRPPDGYPYSPGAAIRGEVLSINTRFRFTDGVQYITLMFLCQHIF